MNPKTNQTIDTSTIVLAIVVAIFILVLIAVGQSKSSVPSNAKTVTAVTATSAPKVSSLPSFSGFDTLVDDGLADDQLTGLEYAFGVYSKSLPVKIKQVSIDKGSILAVPRDRNSTSPNNVINFAVKLDGTTYTAEVDYSSLSPVQLKLFDAVGGATVFDSGVIDINTQVPND
ncbi:MAG: hypothetical protein ABIR37_02670 [Candidatus Saccharimonadales bacterium]